MDVQSENRLHSVETMLAISAAKQLKAERVWLSTGDQCFTIAFDHGEECTAFTLPIDLFAELVQGALLLDYNLLS